MKSVSIIAIGVLALIALCSSAPVVDQQVEVQARIELLNFIYDNILQDLFSGLVTNTFNHLSGALNNLITTNPLGIGKRDVDNDLSARLNIFTFVYENILQDLFTGLVSNTFNELNGALNNLITTNPLGIGKRDVDNDLSARLNIFTFIYDNILQNLFTDLVSNTFNEVSGALNNLITTNPLGIGKRAEGLNIFQFLYENIVADLFGGLASNTANYLQTALQNLLNKPLAAIGKRSVDIQQAEASIAHTISTLIEKFKTFAHQAIASIDQQKLAQLVKDNIADIKALVANLAKQLSSLIPSTIVNEVSHVLAALQSVLIFWTSGLGGSLGPVIGPFRP